MTVVECVSDTTRGSDPNLQAWEEIFDGQVDWSTIEQSDITGLLEQGPTEEPLIYVGSPTHDVIRSIGKDDYCKITEKAVAVRIDDESGATITEDVEGRRILYIDDPKTCPVPKEYLFKFEQPVVGVTKDEKDNSFEVEVKADRWFILFPENCKLTVDRINHSEEDAEKFYVGGGGPNGAFDSAGLVKCMKHLLGRVGDDTIGQKIRNRIEQAGITDNLAETHHPSRQSLIYVLPNKDRLVITTNSQHDESDSPLEMPEGIAGGTAHVFSQHNIEDFNAITQALEEAGILNIGITPSSRSEMGSPEIEKSLARARVLAVNSEEAIAHARTLFPEEYPEERKVETKEDLKNVAARLLGRLATRDCLKEKNAFVAISDSWHGSFIIDKKGNAVASTPYMTEAESELGKDGKPKGINNRLGAGDGWTALLTYILLALEDVEPDDKKRMEYAIDIANVLSGMVCMEEGPNVSKTPEEVEREKPKEILSGRYALAG